MLSVLQIALGTTAGKVSLGLALSAAAAGGIVVVDLVIPDEAPPGIVETDTTDESIQDDDDQLSNYEDSSEPGVDDRPEFEDPVANDAIDDAPDVDSIPESVITPNGLDNDENNLGENDVEKETEPAPADDSSTSSDLDGCERGQAIASDASGKEKDTSHCTNQGNGPPEDPGNGNGNGPPEDPGNGNGNRQPEKKGSGKK